MNDIEAILRRAPQPVPPISLKERLLTEIPTLSSRTDLSLTLGVPFWRRWFPALSFGAILLGCFIVLAVQTRELIGLQRQNATLRQFSAALEQLRRDNAELHALRSKAAEISSAQRDEEELTSLRREIAERRNAMQDAAELKASNQRLASEIKAAQAKAGFVPEQDPLAEAKAAAEKTACMNNLKQIMLATRIWANTHGDVLPVDFLTIKNELATPKVLLCPSDTARQQPSDWSQFNPLEVSYDILSPGVDEADPEVVYVRCRIHGSVGRVDGSAQGLNPDIRLITRDGKTKIEWKKP
jgi:hypothetical protein